MPLRPSWDARGPEDPGSVAGEILRMSALGELTLFVGSFVSVRSPAALPMAADLKEAILTGLWRGVRSRLAPALEASPSTVLRASKWPELPLEMLVEAVLGATGLPVDRLLSFLGEAAPNYNHVVLATILDRGMGRVVTTNFDELIERARSSSDDARGLSKPHGTFSDPDGMTVEMTQVGRQVASTRTRTELGRDLRGRDVCFIGYSGRDLDIRPILKGAAVRSVLWIMRPPWPEESAADLAAARDQVRRLFGESTHVRCVSVDADEVFDALGRPLSAREPAPTAGNALPWEEVLTGALGAVPWERQADAIAHILSLSGCPGPAADVYGVLELADLPPRVVAKAALGHARMLYRQQRFPEAKTAAQRAVGEFRRLGDREGLAGCYGLLALILERSGQKSGWALRYLRKSIDFYPAQRSRAAIGARLDLGVWLKNRGQFGQAERTFRRALRDARAVGALDAQMKLQMCLGILRGTERHEALVAGDSVMAARLARSARYHLRRSRASARFLAVTEDELRAVSALIALELDRSLRRRGLTVAGELLDEAEWLALESAEPDQRWNVASMRGDWLNQKGRSEEAVALLTLAVQNARKTAYVFAALRERGRALRDLGESRAAEADFARAVELAPAGPHRRSAASLLTMEAEEGEPVAEAPTVAPACL